MEHERDKGDKAEQGQSKRKPIKLTKRTIDALPPGDPKGTWYYDEEVGNFILVVYGSGKKSFYVRLRVGRKKPLIRIGTYGSWTVDAARAKARQLIAQAEAGGDPADERRRRRAVPTWQEWAVVYAERAKLEKKSGFQDVRFLGLGEKVDTFHTIRRRWQSRAVDQLTAEDVLTARDELRKTPVQANRWLASIRAAFSAAIRSGHASRNPARDVPKLKEGPPRQRVLAPVEMEALRKAVEAEDDPHARLGLLILLDTGARLSEVLRAKWEDFSDLDGEQPSWLIPSPKAGEPQAIPITKQLAAEIQAAPRLGPYVIAGRVWEVKDGKEPRPRADLKGPWERALEAAKLTKAEITIHDLRRSFGLSVYRTSGLLAAQKLLRHSDSRITSKVYAPQSAEDLRAAIERRTGEPKKEEKK